LSFGQCNADSVKDFKPKQRQYWHDEVDDAQHSLLKWDGTDDGHLKVSSDETVNFLVNQTATTGIDCFQYRVENDSTMGAQKKIGYLRWYAEFLRMVQRNWSDRNPRDKAQRLKPVQLPSILESFEKALDANGKGYSLLNVINDLDYASASIILKSAAFQQNPELQSSRDEVIRKYCVNYPDKILSTLS